ncbi:MAG TPA: PAS domain-containing protein [Chloroflexota bacterium]|nr:PAS domain-containing protein [Chloroflexota bacterium]
MRILHSKPSVAIVMVLLFISASLGTLVSLGNPALPVTTAPAENGLERVSWVLPASHHWDLGLRAGDVVRRLPGSSPTQVALEVTEGKKVGTVAAAGQSGWSPTAGLIMYLLGLEFFAAGLLVFWKATDRSAASRFALLAEICALTLVFAVGENHGQIAPCILEWVGTKLTFAAFALFFLTTPVPRWGRLKQAILWALLPLIGLYLYSVVAIPSPYDLVKQFGFMYMLVTMAVSVLALAWPFLTRAPRPQRQLWPVALAIILAAGVFVIGAPVSYLVTGRYLIPPASGIISFAFIPLGFMWAMLRYRIMGVDITPWALLKSVFDTIADPIFVADRHGRLFDANRAGLSLLGVRRPSELVGSFDEQMARLGADSRDSPDPGVSPLQRVLSGSSLHDLSQTLTLPNGEAVFMSVSGSPILDERGEVGLAVLAFRDITERKRAEEALHDSEERYRTVMEAVDDAVYVKDASGRYVTVNTETARRLGMSQQSIPGKTDVELLGPDIGGEIRKHDQSIMEAVRAGSAEEEYPDRVLAPLCQVRKVPLRGEKGEVVGLVSVSRDVTELKSLEEQLRLGQRLEVAGRMAAQVAHDFNNLLGPLVAYPEMIMLKLPPDHPGVTMCEHMLSAAQQMADINQDMMALGRRGVLEAGPVDLNRVVYESVARLTDVPPSLEVIEDLSPASMLVAGSDVQLHRVMANLIANAREAMNDSGTLTLKTENVYLDQPGGHHCRVETGEYVRLSVSDTGCGIPETILPRIFDAFFSTRRKRRGSGLGLSIVQAIVGDHRGCVDLETAEGVGTTFHIYLPVCREAIADEIPAEIASGNERVLVVDDDVIQREVTVRALGDLGYQVDAVPSGEAALEYLGKHAVDLLVLDMVMPGGMDGAETYSRVVERQPGIRAIILSGFVESDRVELAQQLGAGAFVRKPASIRRLATAVREELDRTAHVDG